MTKLSHQELINNLSEILSCNAFELHSETLDNSLQNFYIPYMMNDALECYITLTNSHMTGSYISDFKGEITVELVESDSRPALIFHQGTDNVFTIWFEEAYKELKLYRYDQIGHFWVKGQEHWRQLVYIIGTMYDKYAYLGNEVCNEEELALIPLMEFAPFRYYSPIHEPLDEYYPNTENGLYCMQSLALEVQDRSFYYFTRIYEKLPYRWISNLLAKALNHPKRQSLYEHIYKKMQSASIHYSERSYASDLNNKITAERKSITDILLSKGFTGEYPRFYKDNIQILATEEHPFTILESDTFDFKIQLMVSESFSLNQIVDINNISDL